MKYHLEAKEKKPYAVPIVMETNSASEVRNFFFLYLAKNKIVTAWREE